jgi:ribose 5-phosphate isomerase A
MTDLEAEKRAAAREAAALVGDGMLLGLGTGSTVAHLLPALAGRAPRDLRCVATSPATEALARELGLTVEPFEGIARLDLAIDGADQVTPDGWLIKGGGGAHTREKLVAAAADRFAVIVSSDKLVAALRPPVPLELLAFGLDATLHALGDARPRAAPPSPDGGVIADLDRAIDDPAELAAALDAMPGVVAHGLFAPALVSDVFVARGETVEHRRIAS